MVKNIKIIGNGPIIITTPHTIVVSRGIKTHINEVYLIKIVNKLLKLTNIDLFTIIRWSKNHKNIPHDPSYCIKSQLKKSEWYNAIITKSAKHKNPLLFDIHGMTDQSSNADINIGIKSLKVYKPLKYLNMNKIINKLVKINSINIIKSKKFSGYRKKYLTLTSQAAMNNIPSIQFELAKSYRKKLIDSDNRMINFIKLLINVYLYYYTTSSKKK